MNFTPLPQQESKAVYVHEVVTGTLWQADDETVHLSLAPEKAPNDVTILLDGEIVLRYAIAFLQRPFSLVIGYFETENGAVKTGEAAWKFIWKKWQLYPRAEVIGVSSRGEPMQVYLKDLDFGEPAQILAYVDSEADIPLAEVQALHIPSDANLPPLLAALMAL